VKNKNTLQKAMPVHGCFKKRIFNMEIIKKDIHQLTNELQRILDGGKKGNVFTLPIGADLYPDRLTPQIEMVLLDPAENIVAFRTQSHPESLNKRVGNWMLGQLEAVASVALEWTEKMIKQKEEEGIS
jgi:hypothetical protein